MKAFSKNRKTKAVCVLTAQLITNCHPVCSGTVCRGKLHKPEPSRYHLQGLGHSALDSRFRKLLTLCGKHLQCVIKYKTCNTKKNIKEGMYDVHLEGLFKLKFYHGFQGNLMNFSNDTEWGSPCLTQLETSRKSPHKKGNTGLSAGDGRRRPMGSWPVDNCVSTDLVR